MRQLALLVVTHGVLKSLRCDGEFIDIGVPEDYSRAQSVMASRVTKWKIAFFDRDGTINVDTHHLYKPELLQLIPQGVELLKSYSDDPEYKTVVVTNQAGIAKGLYGVEDMEELHRFLDSKLAEADARVDAYYYCPHHPDYTGPCKCRKPSPGMLLKALFDFDADPAECVLYGDKQSDIEAAHAAAVQGKLVNFQSVKSD